MRIRELLKKEGIALGVKVDSKDAAIDYLIEQIRQNSRKEFLQEKNPVRPELERESQFLIPRMQQLSSRDLQL